MKISASEIKSGESEVPCCSMDEGHLRVTIPLTKEALQEFTIGQAMTVVLTGTVVELTTVWEAEVRLEVSEVEVKGGKNAIEELVVEEDD